MYTLMDFALALICCTTHNTTTVYGCGTVMPNRKFFPKDFTERALQHGDNQWRQDHNGGMVATVWMNRKPIYFLSSIHVAEYPYTFVVRHDKKGNDLIFTAPLCVFWIITKTWVALTSMIK